uniref:Uncharacterized protein n=1 Tax=Globodera pallida TaxID=36090 RepID=A0A183C9R9_GLOPA
MDFGNLHPVDWEGVDIFNTMEEVYEYTAARGCYPSLQEPGVRVYFQCYRRRHHGKRKPFSFTDESCYLGLATTITVTTTTEDDDNTQN